MAISNSLAALGPLRSVHTTTFPALLQELGLSLVVSTYQAGKVVLIRADGEMLNTHFRVLQKPMGLAVNQDGRIAIALNPRFELARQNLQVLRQRVSSDTSQFKLQ